MGKCIYFCRPKIIEEDSYAAFCEEQKYKAKLLSKLPRSKVRLSLGLTRTFIVRNVCTRAHEV